MLKKVGNTKNGHFEVQLAKKVLSLNCAIKMETNVISNKFGQTQTKTFKELPRCEEISGERLLAEAGYLHGELIDRNRLSKSKNYLLPPVKFKGIYAHFGTRVTAYSPKSYFFTGIR